MIKYYFTNSTDNNFLAENLSENAYLFHKTLPNYLPSSLHTLSSYAKDLGVKEVLVKDESERFGLNAFKILGASWAVAATLAEYYRLPETDITFSNLKELAHSRPKLTFVTATDVNHGRGVARAAKWFNQEAIVYMPKGASQQRIKAIENEAARVTVLDMNYDDAVRYAHKKAADNNWILLQDTAFEDYRLIPQRIMDGYETIVREIVEQTSIIPTHIFLQVGVGSLAGAIINGFLKQFKNLPTIIIVEPENAACYYHSILSKKLYTVEGELSTIMAGLSCGQPSTIAYDIIVKTAKAYFSLDDNITKKGMRRLANPLENDTKIISGESGAVGIGLLDELCSNKDFAEIRDQLKLNEEAIVLCISTEGATDLESYESILNVE